MIGWRNPHLIGAVWPICIVGVVDNLPDARLRVAVGHRVVPNVAAAVGVGRSPIHFANNRVGIPRDAAVATNGPVHIEGKGLFPVDHHIVARRAFVDNGAEVVAAFVEENGRLSRIAQIQNHGMVASVKTGGRETCR